MTKKLGLIASLLLVIFAGGTWYWQTSSTGCCRLEIQRSFHRGIVFEIQRSGMDLVLKTKFYAGAGKVSDSPTQNMWHALIPSERDELNRLLLKAREPLSTRRHGLLLDGSSWNFRPGGPLTTTQSWLSPGSYGPDPVWELGQFFWRIAKVDEPEKNLY